MGQRATSGQARWLAPLAVAVLAIAILIVAAGSSVEESGNGSTRTTAAGQTTTTTDQGRDGGEQRYVVQPGDTLSSIALETGIPVDQLQSLNPDVDPQALASGERLKLR